MRIIKLIFCGLTAVMVLSLPVYAFTDVSGQKLHADSIQFLAEQGVVQGYADGSYGYNKAINRAEMLKILVEARYLNENKVFLSDYTFNCFSDVPANEWFTPYVCYSKSKGWVNGYEGNVFKPAQNINFVEALKLVSVVFGDSFSVSEPWYKSIVESASVQNLIPLTIYDFGQVLNRSEMAEMITRKIKFDQGELDQFLPLELLDLKADFNTISAKENLSKYVEACGINENCESTECGFSNLGGDIAEAKNCN